MSSVQSVNILFTYKCLFNTLFVWKGRYLLEIFHVKRTLVEKGYDREPSPKLRDKAPSGVPVDSTLFPPYFGGTSRSDDLYGRDGTGRENRGPHVTD